MKLEVRNLGRIKHAELDIRPLTVFFGPNNTNKTWAAYCLYALAALQSWRGHHRMEASAAPKVLLDPVLRQALESKTEEVLKLVLGVAPDSETTVTVKREAILTGPSQRYRFELDVEGIARTLALTSANLPGASASLLLERHEFDSGLYQNVEIGFRRSPYSVSWRYLAGNESVRTPSRSIQATSLRSDDQIRADMRAILHELLMSTVFNVLALPSERKLLASLYNLFAVGSTLLPNVKLPLRDYAEFIIASAQNRNNPESPLASVANVLELEIQRGQLRAVGQGTPSAQLEYQFDPNLMPLPLRAASSFARSLAGLDLYLRETALPGDLLIIDEPEMNAHPEAQLAIMELLALLVNRGIRVVFTTHSPYLIDHLTNLVEASTLPEDRQEALAPAFKLHTKEAFLDPEKVAAYLFQESGEVVSAFDRETRTIDWGTFSRVTDEVTNLYGRILDAKQSAEVPPDAEGEQGGA